MKWSIFIPLTAAALLSACDKQNGEFKGRPALPVQAGATAKGAGVEGAFTAPKDITTTMNMAPISVEMANLLLPDDQMAVLAVTCMSNVLEGISRIKLPTLRIEMKSQVLGRQSTSDPLPARKVGTPEKFVNFVCKTAAERPVTTAEDADPGIAVVGKPASPRTPAPTKPRPPVAAAATAPVTLPANVKALDLTLGKSTQVAAFLRQEAEDAPPQQVPLTIQCADSAKLDTADQILVSANQAEAPDLVIGTGSKLLAQTKLKSDKPAEFVLITCK